MWRHLMPTSVTPYITKGKNTYTSTHNYHLNLHTAPPAAQCGYFDTGFRLTAVGYHGYRWT